MATTTRTYRTFFEAAGIDYDPPYPQSPIMDKESSIRQYVMYMLNRVNQMFEYDGLPVTIPPNILEHLLQTAGIVCIAKPPSGADNAHGYIGIDASSMVNHTPATSSKEEDTSTDGDPAGDNENSDNNTSSRPSFDTSVDNLYVYTGSLGDRPDVYYQPTHFIVANPYQNFSHSYRIGADCVVIRNDTLSLGLLPMFWRYAYQMADNDISLRCASVNMRSRYAIVADDDRAYKSAQEYLRQLDDGVLSVIMETPMVSNTRVESTTQTSQDLMQLMEYGQYVKASWYNEVGLNSNFNMKREYLSAEEVAVNTDILMPLVDDMLACRQRGLELVNAMFGTHITVRKNSSWYTKQRENDAAEGLDEGRALGSEEGGGEDGPGDAE